MINTKIIAVLAGFAILISLLGGAIRSIPVGQLLLRTLIWGALFAGIGAGLGVVISKFLPELNQIISGENAEEKESKGEFEAVIPEENPHDSLNQDSLFSDMREDTQVEVNVKDDESTPLEELGSEETSTTSEDMTDEPPDETIIKNMDNVPYIDAISEEEQVQKQPLDDNIDNLDTLPEIDSFASSFTPFGNNNEAISELNDNSAGSTSMYSKPKTNMDLGGIVEDPLKTAKAIHTWIERDKEG
jgi:hypothetical protein